MSEKTCRHNHIFTGKRCLICANAKAKERRNRKKETQQEFHCASCGAVSIGYRCTPCSTAATQRYRDADPEKAKAIARKSHEARKSPERVRTCPTCQQEYAGYKCKPCFARYMREWTAKNRERLLREKRAWYQANKERISREKIFAHNTAKYVARLRKLVFDHYGNKCYCCGLDDPRFLTLEHLKNDGHAFRHPGGRRITGTSMLKWVIDNQFPDTIALACWNCNCARAYRTDKTCPHQVKVEQPA